MKGGAVVAELDGQVVLVTGGGRGLGEAVCRRLAPAGATAVVADIRPELAGRVAESIRADGDKADALTLDVTDALQAEEAVHRLADQYGRLDALINNAGVDRTVSVEELPVEDWDRIMAV